MILNLGRGAMVVKSSPVQGYIHLVLTETVLQSELAADESPVQKKLLLPLFV